MSERRRYRNLVPKVELLSPNKSGDDNDWMQWAYCSRTAKKDLFLLYFEKGCDKATVSGAVPNGKYRARWFNPRSGAWGNVGDGTLAADSTGKIVLPGFPGGSAKSKTDWAMKLRRQAANN
jgi:hypothetical protein